MASLLSTSSALSSTGLLLPATPRIQCTQLASVSMISGGQRFVILKAAKRSSPLSHCFKTTISCSMDETLKMVKATVGNHLSINEAEIVSTAHIVFDLGADSLDTVEIMMALEEKFGISVGDRVPENISTIQDVADFIEKFKANA